MKRPEPSPDVMRALETLEAANSPTELGADYQRVLDWRRQNPRPLLTRGGLYFLAALVFAALLLWIVGQIEVTEYMRGMMAGAVIVTLLNGIRDWFSPRPPTPPTLDDRIEYALDKWRYKAPLMREIPR